MYVFIYLYIVCKIIIRQCNREKEMRITLHIRVTNEYNGRESLSYRATYTYAYVIHMQIHKYIHICITRDLSHHVPVTIYKLFNLYISEYEQICTKMEINKKTINK